MKLRRSLLATILAATAGIVPLATGTAPTAHAAPGGLTCDLHGFVLKDPTPLFESGGATAGRGFFGAAKVGATPVPSGVTCTGSINGTATVTGDFVWCPQVTSHNPATNPNTSTSDPTDFNCNGAGGHSTTDEAAYPGTLPAGVPFVAPDGTHPTNVHVVGNGTLTGGTVWQSATGSTPHTCSFSFEGHALAPPRLDVKITCGTQTYTGVAATSFVPVFNTPGDLFEPSDNHANPETCAEEGSPDCFRAVVFEGNITAASTS